MFHKCSFKAPDHTLYFKAKTGHKRNTDPVKYVILDPTLQNAILATMGPTALARAPKDRKIPITVPFCCSVPCCDASVVIEGTTIAVAEIFNIRI